MNILVIDDEPDICQSMTGFLKRLGHSVKCAENGEEGLKLFHSESFEIVITDIRMPVMDGYEATRKIKKSRPELPIIAQTAFALESDRKRAINEGCDDYVAKPIRRNDLLSKIVKNLNLSGT